MTRIETLEIARSRIASRVTLLSLGTTDDLDGR